jgi:hypothetical protein
MPDGDLRVKHWLIWSLKLGACTLDIVSESRGKEKGERGRESVG